MNVYKILSVEAWETAQAAGVVVLAGVDAADGFIHLSAADQVEGTLQRHFADADDLMLAAWEAADLGPDLRWEVSRGGAKFPHFYGQLQTRAAVATWRLSRRPGADFVLPPLP